MARSIERRLSALERQLKAATGLDAGEACRLALQAYNEHGDAALNMPAPADVASDQRLLGVYGAMLDMLWRSEPNRWWSDEPLPLPSVGATNES
jgi:hypothetical protein